MTGQKTISAHPKRFLLIFYTGDLLVIEVRSQPPEPGVRTLHFTLRQNCHTRHVWALIFELNFLV